MYLIYNESLDMFYSYMADDDFPVWAKLGLTRLEVYANKLDCVKKATELQALEDYIIYAVKYIRSSL